MEREALALRVVPGVVAASVARFGTDHVFDVTGTIHFTTRAAHRGREKVTGPNE